MQAPSPHDLPGKLIAVEGVDGSGKSTQIDLLHKWLRTLGCRVFFSEWNSSPLVMEATKKAKRRLLLTPTTFCLIHATDFADRYERQRRPIRPLESERCTERPPLHAAVGFAEPSLPCLVPRRDAQCGGRVKAPDHIGKGHLLVAAVLREEDRRHQVGDRRKAQKSHRSDLDVPERRQSPDDVVDDEAMRRGNG